MTRTPSSTSLFLSPLLACVAVLGAACDGSVFVVDGFGAAEADAEADRLHTYAAGGRVAFTIHGDGIGVGVTVRSADEAVFRVLQADPRQVPTLFGDDDTVLDVLVESTAPGAAELLVLRADGTPVAARPLTFVAVDGVILSRPVGLPDDVEVPVDPTQLPIGERGASFHVRFTAGALDDVHGLGVLDVPDSDVAAVLEQDSEGQKLRTLRDFVRFEPVGEQTPVTASLAGGATALAWNVLPGVVDEVVFVRKDELRARLGEGAVDAETEALLAPGGDERVLCNDTRCATKVEPRDAEGRAIFGAPVQWTIPGRDGPSDGDILTFIPGPQPTEVRVTLGDFSEVLAVNTEEDSVGVTTSTEIVSCSSVGSGGGVVALLALALRSRRRRR
jgi:hypothetical protein